jgi:hypothetical protein
MIDRELFVAGRERGEGNQAHSPVDKGGGGLVLQLCPGYLSTLYLTRFTTFTTFTASQYG